MTTPSTKVKLMSELKTVYRLPFRDRTNVLKRLDAIEAEAVARQLAQSAEALQAMTAEAAVKTAIHVYFEKAHADQRGEYGPGCVHFDKGFGPYAQCEDPDELVPFRAVLARLLTPPDSTGARE